MRLLLAGCFAAGCGAPPAPRLHFAGDRDHALTPSSQVALTALVGGEIRVEGAWSTASTLTVTCQPACETERRGGELIVVHPPSAGRLTVTATLARAGNHERLTETRVYDIVAADDLGLVCRDAHGTVLECDAPQDGKHNTAQVVAYVHGRIVDRVGGMRVDGKEVEAGPFSLADVVDVRVPGLHTVEITGGGLHKKTVIAIAPD